MVARSFTLPIDALSEFGIGFAWVGNSIANAANSVEIGQASKFCKKR